MVRAPSEALLRTNFFDLPDRNTRLRTNKSSASADSILTGLSRFWINILGYRGAAARAECQARLKLFRRNCLTLVGIFHNLDTFVKNVCFQ